MYLLYLDDYHLDDLLYLPKLARVMARSEKIRPPCVVVHGSGGRDERLLEAAGLFPERKDGLIQARTAQEAALVERALRQVNRRIVGMLTEEGVHAVGFQGSDRGLLRQEEGGAVVAGRVDWLSALIEKRVVPVVSALARGAEGRPVQAVRVSEAVVTLARALDAGAVVFFTRNDKPGIFGEEGPLRTLALEALPEAILPDSVALGAVVRAGLPTLMTNAQGLFGGVEREGTMIITMKTAKKD